MTIKITRLASRLTAMKYHTNREGHSHKAGAATKERGNYKMGGKYKNTKRRKQVDLLMHLLCSGICIVIFFLGGKGGGES